MASFTDKIPTFNPYVQQMPVESMLQVGMEKQRRYDEGVQKIQSQIDTIAGLPILRDVDKQHLQSKLHELGNNLKGFAASDFSNYQLVNAVSGMTNKIAKDPYIQAAVQSTAWDQKQMEAMEEDKKKSGGNPANDDNYYKRRSEYLNAGLGTPDGKPIVFSNPYNAFFDVDKFTREMFDAVKPNSFTFDEIWQTDENGKRIVDKVLNPKTGKMEESYRLSTYMSQLKQEGRFPPEVAKTLNQIMSDPRVTNQLQISGEYTYKNLTPEELGQKLVDTKARQMAGYDEVIANLQTRMNATTSQDEKAKIQTEIDKTQVYKETIESQFGELAKLTETNPDGLRGLLYKDEVRDNYRSMFTTLKEERTFMASPAWQANFEMRKEANLRAYQQDELRYKYAALDQDRLQFDATMKFNTEKEAKNEGGYQLPTEGAFRSDTDYVGYFNQSYDKAAATYASNVDDLIFSTETDQKRVNEYLAANRGVTPQQAKAALIDAMAMEKGISPDDQKGMIAFRTKLYMRAKLKLNNMIDPDTGKPIPLDPIVEEKLRSAENAEQQLDEFMMYKNEIDKQAPLVVPVPELTTEIIELAKTAKRIDSIYEDNKAAAQKAQQRLQDMGVSQAVIDFVTERAGSPTFAIKMAYKNKFNQDEEIKIANERRAEAIKNIYKLNPVLDMSLTTGETKVDNRHMATLQTLLGDYVANKQNLEKNVTGKASIMNNVFSGEDKSGSVAIQVIKDEITGELNPVIKVYSDGKPAGTMAITVPQAANLGLNIPSWFKRQKVKYAEMRLDATGNESTARGDINSVQTYKMNDVVYRKGDFKNLSQLLNYNVKGNVKRVSSTDNNGNTSIKYFNYLYICDLKTGKEYVRPLRTATTSMDEALLLFDGLTPQHIETLISEQQTKE